MSVVLDSTTDRCKFDATAPAGSPAGDYTVMVWWLSTNFVTRYQTCFTFGSQGTSSTAIFVQPSPTTSKIEVYAQNGTVTLGTTALSTSTWYHVTLVGNTGTSQSTTLYLNGVSEGSGNSGVGVFNGQRMEYGNAYTGESTTGQVACGKVWNAKLTVSEILQEMLLQRPQRTANLWQWCPMLNSGDLRDYSGNVRDLTGTTLTDGQGPPVTWSAFLPSVYIPAAVAPTAPFPPFRPQPTTLQAM